MRKKQINASAETETPENKPVQAQQTQWQSGTGLALGLCFGCVFDVIFDRTPIGISLGLLAGIIIDQLHVANNHKPTNNKEEPDETQTEERKPL